MPSPNETPLQITESAVRKRVSVRQYLLLHWRGRLPLAASYWINSSFLTAVAYVVIGVVAEVLRRAVPWANVAVTGLAMSLMLLVFVWGSVGTWRAGTVYDQTSKWPFGACAKFVLMVAAVRMFYGWV